MKIWHSDWKVLVSLFKEKTFSPRPEFEFESESPDKFIKRSFNVA